MYYLVHLFFSLFSLDLICLFHILLFIPTHFSHFYLFTIFVIFKHSWVVFILYTFILSYKQLNIFLFLSLTHLYFFFICNSWINIYWFIYFINLKYRVSLGSLFFIITIYSCIIIILFFHQFFLFWLSRPLEGRRNGQRGTTRPVCFTSFWLLFSIFFYYFLFCFKISVYALVLYCVVLYCIVLYCVVLYCIVLYYIVKYCIMLYCIVLNCIVLWYIWLHSVGYYFALLFCVLSWFIF